MAKLEQDIEKLEDIIRELETGDKSLDDSFALYEEGLKLIKSCNDSIEKIEQKLTVIKSDDEEV